MKNELFFKNKIFLCRDFYSWHCKIVIEEKYLNEILFFGSKKIKRFSHGFKCSSD